MRAFELFKTQTGSEMRLLIVGEKKWWDNAHEETFQSLVHKNDIHFAGRLMANELHKVLSAAFALTFVPIFEGFGIPIIEAFSCGTPVITSNVTSMPEVAGGAALLVDPFQEKDIAEKMKMLVDSEDLQKQLIEKGLKRKEAFSWDSTASHLWKCIENVLVKINA